MTDVLVAGGAGFLGSYVCDRLHDAGESVICVDNLASGAQANISHLLESPRFKFIEQDVCLPLDVEAKCIFNMACPASPIHYQQDPVQTLKSNVFGAMNLLDLARRYDALILQSSTSEVYGDPEVHPQVEAYWGNVNPIGARACYDEGKRCAETLFFDYHRQYGLNIKVARIFNTFGPRMRSNDGRVVSNFVVQALTGQNITIYGDGSQTRSFCYVDDMIDAFMLLKDSEREFVGPVNFGNPHEVSMLELAEMILRLVGGPSRLIHHDLPADDPVRRKPDITLAESKLGWAPKVALEDGLRETVHYFRHQFELS